MQSIQRPAQTGEQPTTLGALAEMVLQSRASRRRKFPVQVVGHPAPGPPVIPPETLSVQQIAHHTSDPLSRAKGSHLPHPGNVASRTDERFGDDGIVNPSAFLQIG
jgi:hypothetical protein